MDMVQENESVLMWKDWRKEGQSRYCSLLALVDERCWGLELRYCGWREVNGFK